MGKSEYRFWSAAVFRRTLNRWQHAADDAPAADLTLLRRQRSRARALRHQIDRLLHTAEARLTRPLRGDVLSTLPYNTDWQWRPGPWLAPLAEAGIAAPASGTPFGTEITLFHDGTRREIILRQIRNPPHAHLPVYALHLDVLEPGASFVSLSLDLPAAAIRDLRKEHVFRVDARLRAETPLAVFVRLNIAHGPNTESLVRSVPADEGSASVTFDLAFEAFDPRRVEKAWIDIIFERPDMNAVTVQDFAVSRFLRAEI